MTSSEQQNWSRVAVHVRQAAATAEALASGYVDNHGGSLGDATEAGKRLAARLRSRCALMIRGTEPRTAATALPAAIPCR